MLRGLFSGPRALHTCVPLVTLEAAAAAPLDKVWISCCVCVELTLGGGGNTGNSRGRIKVRQPAVIHTHSQAKTRPNDIPGQRADSRKQLKHIDAGVNNLTEGKEAL